MKLLITAPSPYARKCRIVAREKGIALEEIVADPYANAPELVASNPIVQVPTLIAADGLPLTDSPVICEHLDEIGQGARLLPPGGPDRLHVKRLETFAGAALEMGVKLLLEKRRPEAERSLSWMRRWEDNMSRALDVAEAAVPDGEPFHMGTLSLAVAMTWIDFRHPGFDAGRGRPRLAALTAELERRPSFVETRPV